MLPYALLRYLFAFRFDIHDDDAAAIAREKFVTRFSEEPGVAAKSVPDSHSETRAHLVGHLLGYDFHSSRHLAPLLANPQRLRDRALSYLQEYFEAACASRPVLVLLEDLHWADDSSLEVFSRLSLTMQDQRFLVVGATRPELFDRRPNWPEGQNTHRRLDLQPLSELECRSLAADVLQKVENVPDAILKLITSSAEGNPLYTEELLKMLVQQGVIVKEDESWMIRAERLTELKVPTTLSGVLQARLDNLAEEERLILQQASVIGRIFWDIVVLWDAVVLYLQHQPLKGQSDELINEALRTLREKEIVFQRDLSVFAGANEYVFKHALFRQVTYESVLIRARQSYHALVADWLIEHSGERAEEIAGLIANHLEHAGRLKEALLYLQLAGQEATQLYALVEALRFYDEAVELVAGHPEAFANQELAELRSKRGEVRALAGDFEAAVADLEFAFERPANLTHQAGHGLPPDG
jgi:predicted ATPase